MGQHERMKIYRLESYGCVCGIWQNIELTGFTADYDAPEKRRKELYAEFEEMRRASKGKSDYSSAVIGRLSELSSRPVEAIKDGWWPDISEYDVELPSRKTEGVTEFVTDEEKAKSMAKLCRECRFYNCDECQKCHYLGIYEGARDMALHKNEQFQDVLDLWYEWAKKNCRSEVSFCDCGNMVRYFKEQLKKFEKK